MDTRQQQYAVLTGDLVRSSKLASGDLRGLMQDLRDGANHFAVAFPGAISGELDVFSGDGWQVLMPDWRRSLRAALFLRAVVRSAETTKADTRIAIGWGPVDQAGLNLQRISESTGEAFTRSGRALKEMRRHSRLVLDAALPSGEARYLRVALGLVDEVAASWTPRQAQTLALALLGQRQAEIAAETGRRQPTVQQALRTAGWRGVEALLVAAEYRSGRL
jgi:hypothetical protein